MCKDEKYLSNENRYMKISIDTNDSDKKMKIEYFSTPDCKKTTNKISTIILEDIDLEISSCERYKEKNKYEDMKGSDAYRKGFRMGHAYGSSSALKRFKECIEELIELEAIIDIDINSIQEGYQKCLEDRKSKLKNKIPDHMLDDLPLLPRDDLISHGYLTFYGKRTDTPIKDMHKYAIKMEIFLQLIKEIKDRLGINDDEIISIIKSYEK